MLGNVKVFPLGDRVLVRPDEEEAVSAGGIVLPESAKETPQRGTVVRVGPGKALDSGEQRAMTLSEGDKVIYGKYAGTKIKVGAQELLFMREDDVMAVIKD